MPVSRWRNWGGNHTFPVEELEVPVSEDVAVDLVQRAVRGERSVRAAGSGHSHTPIVAC